MNNLFYYVTMTILVSILFFLLACAGYVICVEIFWAVSNRKKKRKPSLNMQIVDHQKKTIENIYH